jgi:hypothetical protein
VTFCFSAKSDAENKKFRHETIAFWQFNQHPLSEAKDLNQTIVSISSEKLGAARLVFKLWFSLAFAFVAAAF